MPNALILGIIFNYYLGYKFNCDFVRTYCFTITRLIYKIILLLRYGSVDFKIALSTSKNWVKQESQ